MDEKPEDEMTAVQQTRAVAGGNSGRLSREQKAKVCQMAQRAWENQGRPMYADQGDMPAELRLSKSLGFETWRQSEQQVLTGKRSLREMGQGDYCLLMAHFAQLAGEWDEAEYWGRKAQSDEKRRALWHLDQEMRRAAEALGHAQRYVCAIASDKFGTADFAQLGAEQVWTLVFDLRRAAARKRRPVRLPGGAAGGDEWTPGVR